MGKTKMNYIFDLYGTLLKSSGSRYGEIFAELFEESSEFYKKNIREFISKKNFPSVEDGLDRLAEHLGQSISDKKKKQFYSSIEEWIQFHELFPHALDVLSVLKQRGYKVGIVSNASQFIEHMVSTYKLDEHTDFILMSHQTGFLKPDKEAYKLALKKFQCSPSEVTMIGDQLSKDVLPPIEMGMQGILFDPEDKHQDYQGKRINSLRELIG